MRKACAAAASMQPMGPRAFTCICCCCRRCYRCMLPHARSRVPVPVASQLPLAARERHCATSKRKENTATQRMCLTPPRPTPPNLVPARVPPLAVTLGLGAAHDRGGGGEAAFAHVVAESRQASGRAGGQAGGGVFSRWYRREVWWQVAVAGDNTGRQTGTHWIRV